MSDRKYSMKAVLLGVALAAGSLLPAAAWAAEGFATANVNMRSGPSTGYPAVTVIPAGTPVQIHGCLSDMPWCDVSFYNGRGWVAGRYVQAEYRQNRVYVQPDYYDNLGIPIVTFELGNYWDRNYRNRNFYRDRDYWRRGPDGERVRDRDRRPRRDNNDNNYERPRRDNNFERPRRNTDEIIIERPRRNNDDNNFERPRRDRDRDQVDRRRNDNDRNVRNDRDNRRDRDRPDRRNRDNNSRESVPEYRNGMIDGRKIGGPQADSERCRPGDTNCD